MLLSAVSSDHDTDNRGRRYDPTVPHTQNLRASRTEFLQDRTSRRQFLLCGLSLDRQDHTAGLKQARRPARQPVKRRHSPGGGQISLDRPAHILGPAAYHGGIRDLQLRDGLFKEDNAAEHGLQENDVKFRAEHGEDYARKPSPRADID